MKSAVGTGIDGHLPSQRMLLLATSALALVVGSQAGSTKRPNVVIFFGACQPDNTRLPALSLHGERGMS